MAVRGDQVGEAVPDPRPAAGGVGVMPMGVAVVLTVVGSACRLVTSVVGL
ncbi:hypothetical protein ACFVJH_13220 [Streptomyces decoyicus]